MAARRGGTVESVHRVHAVAVRDGEVVARRATRPGHLPPLVGKAAAGAPARARAAGARRPARRDRVGARTTPSPRRSRLSASCSPPPRRTEDDLECGLQEGRPPGQIYHNCSGKHAGMLAVCHARGWRGAGLRLAGHPVQQRDPLRGHRRGRAEPATGDDDCAVVTFALPLERMAACSRGSTAATAATGSSRRCARIPELIGGEGSLDTQLMQSHPGWLAKGGAEGLLCGITARRRRLRAQGARTARSGRSGRRVAAFFAVSGRVCRAFRSRTAAARSSGRWRACEGVRDQRHGGRGRDRQVGADDRRRPDVRGGPAALHRGDQRRRPRRARRRRDRGRRHGLPRRRRGVELQLADPRAARPGLRVRRPGALDRVHRVPRAGLRRGALRRHARDGRRRARRDEPHRLRPALAEPVVQRDARRRDRHQRGALRHTGAAPCCS